MWGDWNIHLNSRVDSSRESTQTSLHKKFKIFMSELGVQTSNNPENILWRLNSSIINNLQFKT